MINQKSAVLFFVVIYYFYVQQFIDELVSVLELLENYSNLSLEIQLSLPGSASFR